MNCSIASASASACFPSASNRRICGRYFAAPSCWYSCGPPVPTVPSVNWIRPPVRPEDVVEPPRRLRRVRLLPRIPRVDRVRLPRHEPPVVRPDLLLLQVPQDRVERAPLRPRHVLRADDRPPVPPQRLDAPL